MSNTYVCELCGGTFTSDRPEALAHAEAVRLWGRRGDPPETSVVYEDCFLEVMAWLQAQGVTRVPS